MEIKKIHPRLDMKLEISLSSLEVEHILNDLQASREEIIEISRTGTFDKFLQELQEALE